MRSQEQLGLGVRSWRRGIELARLMVAVARRADDPAEQARLLRCYARELCVLFDAAMDEDEVVRSVFALAEGEEALEAALELAARVSCDGIEADLARQSALARQAHFEGMRILQRRVEAMRFVGTFVLGLSEDAKLIHVGTWCEAIRQWVCRSMPELAQHDPAEVRGVLLRGRRDLDIFAAATLSKLCNAYGDAERTIEEVRTRFENAHILWGAPLPGLQIR